MPSLVVTDFFTRTSVLVWVINDVVALRTRPHVVCPSLMRLFFPAALWAAGTLDFFLFLRLPVIPPAVGALQNLTYPSGKLLCSPLPNQTTAALLQILPDQESSPSDCFLAPLCSSPLWHLSQWASFCWLLFGDSLINIQPSLPFDQRQWPCLLCPWKSNTKQILADWMN